MAKKFDVYYSSVEWRRSLAEYMALTSKDSATVVNDKTRDWLYKTARDTKKSNRDAIKRTIENPRFISWWLNKKYGKGQWDRQSGLELPPGQIDESSDWADAVKALKRRMSSIGYMRHGYVKMAKKYPDSRKSRPGKQRKVSSRNRFKMIKTRETVANLRQKNPHSKFESLTGARSGMDAGLKEKILFKALIRGRNRVITDMRKYITKKNAKNAKQVSWNG
ncbi:MAG: hypothetical protein ACO2YK_14070 [Paracoccaceae bacterium]